ncbi:hypothetical protein L0Y40_01535 [Candidatus Wolfebacteria bacterium]|nr:hypothetical protein [Candidatus Wolfebacteria bacterium]
MDSQFVTFLNAYSALIQALATAVLVVLTSYYVRQARKSTIELEQTRRSEFLPLLTLRMETRDARTIHVYLSNIGRGLAQDPTVTLPFEKPQQPMKMVVPGQENVRVTFESVGIPEILELPEKERVLKVEYGDIFGRTLVTEAYLASEEAADGELTKQTLTIADWKVFLPGDVVETG